MRPVSLVFGLPAAALLVACSPAAPDPHSAPPPAPLPPPPPSASVAAPVASVSAAPVIETPRRDEPPPPPPKKSAKEILMGGGDFMFSLDDSTDAKKRHEDDCKKKNKKDDKVPECMKSVAEATARDGVRFVKDDKGAWWYVVFGDKKGKEEVRRKMQFKIVADTPTSVDVVADGKDAAKGKETRPMTVEVPDEKTIVVADLAGKSGKLVYKKK